MTKGDLKQTLIGGVNMGRDTDCLTAVAAGMAGALTGAASLPGEWVDQVDRATKQNRFTNSQRTLREHSDGLWEAFRARLRKMRSYAGEMESA